MNYGHSIFGQNQSGTAQNMSGGQQGYPYDPGYSGSGQPIMGANGPGYTVPNQSPVVYTQTPGNYPYQQSGTYPYQSGANQGQPQRSVPWQNAGQPNGIPVNDTFGYGSGVVHQPQFQQYGPAAPYVQPVMPGQGGSGLNQPQVLRGVPTTNEIRSNYERRNYTGPIPGNWVLNQQVSPNFTAQNRGQPNPNGRMIPPVQNMNGRSPAYIPQQLNGGQQQNEWAGPEQTQAGFGAGAHPVSKVKKKPSFLSDSAKLIVSCTALLLLFVLSFFVFKPWLCLVFATLSVAFAVLLWVRMIGQENTRICLTVICAAMSIIAVVNALMPQPPQSAGNGEATAVVSVGGSGNTSAKQGSQGIPFEMEVSPAPTQTPAPDSLQTEAVERLESFFYYWSGNKVEEMLELCSPAWRSSQDIPKNALYSTMAGRIPLDYTMEKVSGTENDTSRTVTLVSNIDRKNGKDPVKYRMQVVMTYENGAWYVDPRSLASLDAEATTAAVSATPSPTPTPEISGDTILYYNPDGGMKYHLDQFCKSAHSKYLPFKGEFRYKDINDSQYAKMTPCNVCGAPLRPSK